MITINITIEEVGPGHIKVNMLGSGEATPREANIGDQLRVAVNDCVNNRKATVLQSHRTIGRHMLPGDENPS